MRVLEKKFGKLNAKVFETRDEMGRHAADDVAKKMISVIQSKGKVRVVFASAPSQNEFLQHMVVKPGIDWSKVEAFHQDEWVGVSIDKEYSFGGFIKKHLFDKVKPGTVHFIDGLADADTECREYGELLAKEPVDIIVLGIGENGHIAFNEPHEADFQDAKVMKKIILDQKCRNQQFNDFGFATLEDVPDYGVTMTIPAIMDVDNIYVVVPGERKAEAVKKALTGEVTQECPASVLRTSSKAALYLNKDSAVLVDELKM